MRVGRKISKKNGSPASNTKSRGRSREDMKDGARRKSSSNSSEFTNSRDRSRNSSINGRPRKPPPRTHSFGVQPLRTARSMSPSREMQRARRARSMSPSAHFRSAPLERPRGRSADGLRGRSSERANRNFHRSRSRSSSFDRFSDEGITRKGYPSQKPQNYDMSKSARRRFQRGRHIRANELSWCKLSQYIVPVCIIIGATVGLVFATGNGSIITEVVGKILDNTVAIDKYKGITAPHWPEDGNGLRVTIINALTEEWQVTFTLATSDWSLGEPDAIEITEEMGTPDRDCVAPEGKVIVCNGNYGDSKWRGVNEAMLDDRGKIHSSSARMNEFYLQNDGGAMQYTMCHEIGHAIGLGHTDEDFDNEDLGNCMDYTNNLDANKHPDKGLYEKLYSIYGPISKHLRLRQRQLQKSDPKSSLQMEHDAHVPDVAGDLVVGNNHQDPHLFVKRLRKRDPSDKDLRVKNGARVKANDSGANAKPDNGANAQPIPKHIQQKREEAVQKLYRRVQKYHSNDDKKNNPVGHKHSDGWKLLHRKEKGEEHEMELGEGYKIRVQFFLVH